MSPIKVVQKGSFNKTEKFFHKALSKRHMKILEQYGQIGVDALKNNTPKDTGKTADSWSYKIVDEDGKVTLSWHNSNTTENGIPITILLIYGHGLQNGSYVQGTDFVSPVIQPIFNQIASKCWKEVVR